MKKTLIALLASVVYLNLILATDVTSVIEQCFSGTPVEKVSVKELKGGLSATALYKLETGGKGYVLRIHKSSDFSVQDELEHYAIIDASKRGIAPKVIYVSPDNQAIVMEYVDGKTLTIEQARLNDTIIKMAAVLTEAHQMKGHPVEGESMLSKAERCHKVILSQGLGSPDQINAAYNLVKNYSQELAKYDYPTVHVHGDLNPRNMFLTHQKILLIDWAETTVEDPFYDLSFFALKTNLNQNDEVILLTSYLKRAPTQAEESRYALHKKRHQAFWSLTNLYLSFAQLQKDPKDKIDSNTPLKTWEDYQEQFANSLGELSAQYFYDLSRLNYSLAK